MQDVLDRWNIDASDALVFESWEAIANIGGIEDVLSMRNRDEGLGLVLGAIREDATMIEEWLNGADEDDFPFYPFGRIE